MMDIEPLESVSQVGQHRDQESASWEKNRNIPRRRGNVEGKKQARRRGRGSRHGGDHTSGEEALVAKEFSSSSSSSSQTKLMTLAISRKGRRKGEKERGVRGSRDCFGLFLSNNTESFVLSVFLSFTSLISCLFLLLVFFFAHHSPSPFFCPRDEVHLGARLKDVDPRPHSSLGNIEGGLLVSIVSHLYGTEIAVQFDGYYIPGGPTKEVKSYSAIINRER